jgi:hypothetical protein
MGIKLVRAFASALTLLGFCASSLAQTVVTGTVKDEAGNPVAGAVVTTTWSARDGKLLPRGAERATVDKDGSFRIDVNLYGRPVPLFAVDPDKRLGGIAYIADAKAAAQAVAIVAKPLRHVKGKLISTEAGRAPEANLLIMSPDKAPVMEAGTKEGEYEAWLPSGSYFMWALSSDYKSVTKDYAVPADRLEIEGPTFDLPLSELAKMTGKPALPLTVTEARGIQEDFSWDKYKGRWVLIEFWGSW